jgi:SAM-dependent methyltransferase
VDTVRTRLPPSTDQYQELISWVGDALPPDASLLDIGAGKGRNPYLAELVGRCSRVAGVDPSDDIDDNPYLTHRLKGYLAYAEGVPGFEPFDAAMAVYVVEHIDDSDTFLNTAHRFLVPGGSLFLLTPNLWHYFGVASLLASRLHVEDWLLKRLRGEELVDDYHFDVQFQMNSVRQLTEAAERAGFARAEFRHLEDPGIFEGYLPERLAWFPRGYSKAVRRLRRGSNYGTLLVRLTRA